MSNKAIFRREDTQGKIRKLDELWNVDDQDEKEQCLQLSPSIYDLAFWAFSLDEDEKEMIKILEQIDADNDGVITEEEIAKVMENEKAKKLILKFKSKRKGFEKSAMSDQEIVKILENEIVARKFERSRIFFRATITFAFQAIIVVSLFTYFTANSSRYYIEFWGSYAATLACLIALQYYFQPVMEKHLIKMRFLFNHTESFESFGMPMLIALFSFLGTMLIMVISLFSVFYFIQFDTLTGVQNYAALTALNLVDTLQYESMGKSDVVVKEYEKSEMKIPLTL